MMKSKNMGKLSSLPTISSLQDSETPDNASELKTGKNSYLKKKRKADKKMAQGKVLQCETIPKGKIENDHELSTQEIKSTKRRKKESDKSETITSENMIQVHNELPENNNNLVDNAYISEVAKLTFSPEKEKNKHKKRKSEMKQHETNSEHAVTSASHRNKGKNKKNKKNKPGLENATVSEDVGINLEGNELVDEEKKQHRDFVRQKLTEERLKKGLVMLSPKAEAKIYKLKKALHRKGLPEEEIKQIIRKRRREEELQYRNTFSHNNRSGHDQNVCFRCRKPGHKFAECRLAVQDPDEGTGVCFRCGSTEHILRDCSSKSKKGRLPYAKCFVCGEQGHISRECPSNSRGAYPRGGQCNQCGSINHLKRDCPQLRESNENEFTGNLMRTGMSADALDD